MSFPLSRLTNALTASKFPNVFCSYSSERTKTRRFCKKWTVRQCILQGANLENCSLYATGKLNCIKRIQLSGKLLKNSWYENHSFGLQVYGTTTKNSKRSQRRVIIQFTRHMARIGMKCSVRALQRIYSQRYHNFTSMEYNQDPLIHFCKVDVTSNAHRYNNSFCWLEGMPELTYRSQAAFVAVAVADT